MASRRCNEASVCESERLPTTRSLRWYLVEKFPWPNHRPVTKRVTRSRAKSDCEQDPLDAMPASCLPLALYGSAALVKVVPPPPAASTWTMLASPETAALRKH